MCDVECGRNKEDTGSMAVSEGVRRDFDTGNMVRRKKAEGMARKVR